MYTVGNIALNQQNAQKIRLCIAKRPTKHPFYTATSHLSAYAGNNPVKYVDPDGRIILATSKITGNDFYQQDSKRYIAASNTLVSSEGCYATANARVINAINAIAKAQDPSLSSLPTIGVDFTISQNEFFENDSLSTKTSGEMINKFTVFDTSTTRIENKNDIKNTLTKFSNSKTEHAAIVGKMKVGTESHFFNIEGIKEGAKGELKVSIYDTSTKRRTSIDISKLVAIEITTWNTNTNNK